MKTNTVIVSISVYSDSMLSYLCWFYLFTLDFLKTLLMKIACFSNLKVRVKFFRSKAFNYSISYLLRRLGGVGHLYVIFTLYLLKWGIVIISVKIYISRVFPIVNQNLSVVSRRVTSEVKGSQLSIMKKSSGHVFAYI